MQTVLTSPRLRLSANQVRTSPTITIQTGAEPRLRVELDLTDADQLDPLKRVSLTIEARASSSEPWYLLAKADTWGAPERAALLLDADTARPWVEFTIPPAGSEVRATISAGPSALDVGLIVSRR